MRKLYSVLLFACFGSHYSKAQFAPLLGDTTEWCVAYDFVTVLQDPNEHRWVWDDQHYVAAGDSVYGVDTFKIMRNYLGTVVGLIREDTLSGTVYFRGLQGTTQKIYDFSMNLGDTIVINCMPGCSFFQSGVYTVDSVGTMQTQAGPRKYLRLTSPVNTTQNQWGFIPRLEWVEGIGALYDPRYVDDENNYGYPMLIPQSCDNQGTGQMLIRKLRDGITEYSRPCFFSFAFYSPDSDSCIIDYSGSVNELNNAQVVLLVYPNPTHGATTIELGRLFMSEGNLRVYAIDVAGKKIEISAYVQYKGSDVIIPHRLLNAGYYTITVEAEKFTGMARLVVIN
jgi:hypothetical protein